jgi:uncharacterized membrane protein
LFALAAGAGIVWLYPSVLNEWKSGWRIGWQIMFGMLLFGAGLFPLAASMDKITDRMSDVTLHTLDGMVYMRYSRYSYKGVDMVLNQDYEAIQWMQDNVKGSPVIVEANTRDLYTWGSRYTIYTGLPGVLGWDWHQRQQRAIVPSEWINNRVDEIAAFYTTLSKDDASSFLRKYNVKYIIMGQLERAYYKGEGLDKFDQFEGDLWKEVYRKDDTVIYQVLG